MPARAVINVDVDPDGKFKAFAASYDKFKKQIEKLPEAWQGAAAAQGEMGKGFQSMAAALMAQLEMLRQSEKAERDAARAAREVETVWGSISSKTRSAAGNIASATGQLLKWTALTSVFSGLLGAGGLFGIERLAGNVAGGRRSSLGLGVSSGEQAAFGLNFGRLVDPDSFLGAVNAAQHDVTKRSGLYGAGLREGDIASKDSSQVGAQLLGRLKRIVDATPENQLAQTLQSRGLDQFIGLQDAQRLRNTGPSEMSELLAGFRKDQGTLGLSPANQKVWTDFSTQMSRAGSEIENVFVKGLTPLIPSLTELSASVTKAVSAFLASPKLKEWLVDLGQGIEHFAEYVGKPEFTEKIKSFVDALGEVGDAILKVAGWIGEKGGNTGSAIAGTVNNPSAAYTGSGSSTPTSSGGSVPRNNPGNLRPPGSGTGFQQFSTPEEGYAAMQRQLLLYYNRDHLSSVGQIVNKWAPPSENDTGAYVGDVAKRMGVSSMDKLDLSNPDTMSKLIAAMAHHENSKNTITSAQVKITLYGAPGGNVVANAHQTTTPGN